MKRQIGPTLLIFLALGLFGGFTYFTRNPDSPWLEKAQEWPIVGDLARAFRTTYLGPETSESTQVAAAADASPPAAGRETRRAAPAAPTEPLRLPSLTRMPETADSAARTAPGSKALPRAEPVPRIVTTSPAPVRPVVRPTVPPAEPTIKYVASEWLWFLPGHRLLAAPQPDAQVHATLEAMAHLPVLSRDGLWAEVMYGNRKSWIDTSWKPSHPRKGARRGILRHRTEPIRASDSLRLRRARKILGIDRPSVKLGAYTLYTDIEDEDLLALLDSAATAAEEAYFARYGRLPSGNPKRSVILFAKESSYRQYSDEIADIPGDRTSHAGHAGSGVLAFYAEGRSRESLTRTLVHEITHLLNDRSLARRLPSWLEEGLASDLGTVWVEDSPEVERARQWSLTIQGPEMRFLALEEQAKKSKLQPLTWLLGLDKESFYQPEVQSYAYAHSFAFIRYLLDGEDGRLAPGFLAFLKRIAGGLEANLLKQLDVGLEELERGFRVWLGAQVRESHDRMNRWVARRRGS